MDMVVLLKTTKVFFFFSDLDGKAITANVWV